MVSSSSAAGGQSATKMAVLSLELEQTLTAYQTQTQTIWT